MWTLIRELVLFAVGFMAFSLFMSIAVLVTIAITDTVRTWAGSKRIAKMLGRWHDARIKV